MAAVANTLMDTDATESSWRPLYVVVPDFLDYLRTGYDEGQRDEGERSLARMEAAKGAGVLLLDDLGAEKASAWGEEQLFKLLNWRYIHAQPTVIATNVLLDQLEGRIASRMRDRALAKVLVVTGPDRRRAGGAAAG